MLIGFFLGLFVAIFVASSSLSTEGLFKCEAGKSSNVLVLPLSSSFSLAVLFVVFIVLKQVVFGINEKFDEEKFEQIASNGGNCSTFSLSYSELLNWPAPSRQNSNNGLDEAIGPNK